VSIIFMIGTFGEVGYSISLLFNQRERCTLKIGWDWADYVVIG
jgi:hypothetical protein